MPLFIMYLLISLIIIVIIYIMLICPDFTGKQKASFLLGKNIAHRGLYNNDGGIPENSLEAARKSVLCGFGVELDLRLSSDGEVMVFHDETLERMTSHEGAIHDYTKNELQQISLLGTKQTIPTLSQYLEIVDGKVPLIIELKDTKQNPHFCEKVATILDNYRGDFVVESFFPDILIWFKKNRPSYIRGQLSLVMKKGEKSFLIRFVLAYLLTNFLSKPHFISYRHEDVDNLSFKICKAYGAMTVGWTIDTLPAYKKSTAIFDTIIFEKILPANDYMPEKKGNVTSMQKVKGEISNNTSKVQNADNNK